MEYIRDILLENLGLKTKEIEEESGDSGAAASSSTEASGEATATPEATSNNDGEVETQDKNDDDTQNIDDEDRVYGGIGWVRRKLKCPKDFKKDKLGNCIPKGNK